MDWSLAIMKKKVQMNQVNLRRSLKNKVMWQNRQVPKEQEMGLDLSLPQISVSFESQQDYMQLELLRLGVKNSVWEGKREELCLLVGSMTGQLKYDLSECPQNISILLEIIDSLLCQESVASEFLEQNLQSYLSEFMGVWHTSLKGHLSVAEHLLSTSLSLQTQDEKFNAYLADNKNYYLFLSSLLNATLEESILSDLVNRSLYHAIPLQSQLYCLPSLIDSLLSLSFSSQHITSHKQSLLELLNLMLSLENRKTNKELFPFLVLDLSLLHRILKKYDLFSCSESASQFFSLLVDYTYGQNICDQSQTHFLVHLRDLVIFYCTQPGKPDLNLLILLNNVFSEGEKGVTALWTERTGEFLVKAAHSKEKDVQRESVSALSIFCYQMPDMPVYQHFIYSADVVLILLDSLVFSQQEDRLEYQHVQMLIMALDRLVELDKHQGVPRHTMQIIRNAGIDLLEGLMDGLESFGLEAQEGEIRKLSSHLHNKLQAFANEKVMDQDEF